MAKTASKILLAVGVLFVLGAILNLFTRCTETPSPYYPSCSVLLDQTAWISVLAAVFLAVGTVAYVGGAAIRGTQPQQLPVNAVFCSKCKQPMVSSAAFCPYCGEDNLKARAQS